MRDTPNTEERGRGERARKNRERERERLPEPGGKSGREDDAKGKKVHEAEEKTKRVGARREARERRGGRERDVERGSTEGEESGPFDGAFVGSRGALRFATKIVALLACVRRSPRRVICGEFINATRSRARRSNASVLSSPSRLGRAEFGARAYSIASFRIFKAKRNNRMNNYRYEL